ncbi:MAG: trigger factor [Bacteroidota bacterium]
MPTVVRENVDELSAVLTVKLLPEDYQPKLNTELKKYAQKAQIKGFRKGKTPESYVKKLYGQSLLLDIVNNEVKESLSNYIREEKLVLFGEPLINEKQTIYDFDVFKPEPMDFLFDIGLYPEVNITGIDKETTYDYFVKEVSDDTVDEAYTNLLKDLGEPSPIESGFTSGDLLTCDFIELINGEERADSLKVSNILSFDDLSDHLKDQIKLLSVGDTFTVDKVYDLEPKLEEKRFRKHVLKLEDTDESTVSENFQIKITEAKRIQPATEDETFFQKAFGVNNVSNAEEGKAVIKKHIGNETLGFSNGLLYRDIQEKLMANHDVPLPEAFIKRYLLESDKHLTEEKLSAEFSGITSSIKWSYLKSRLLSILQVVVTKEMVQNHLGSKIRGYFGQQVAGMESFIQNMVEKMMEDEKQVNQAYDELENSMLMIKIQEAVTLHETILSKEEFEEKTKIFNRQNSPDEETPSE